jgi:1,2-diacylglycerol 3-alpha-glucosyltransferase
MGEFADRPLRVAFFVEGMYASGVDTSTQLLARALRQLGHRVTLFTPWSEASTATPPEETFQLSAVEVNLKQRVHLSYPISWRLINAFRQQRYDLIHVHTSTSVNLLAWQVSKLFQLPVVYSYHTMTKEYLHYLGFSEQIGSLLDPVVELFDKIVCDRADLVVTPAAKAAEYLHEIGVTPEVKIVPNGVDLELFHPFPSDFLQSQYAIPADAKLLLFVGRLNQEKRPLVAYEIFRRLCRTRDDLYLIMVGQGPLAEDLRQMAASDGLSSRLVLTGLIDYGQMPAVYNAADLWISTSQSEVQPMVALEAAACGLPALAFADPALRDIVEHGVSGFLVHNEDEFIAYLLSLLEEPERYHAMRKAALTKGECYSVTNSAKRMVDCYRQVLATQEPPNAGTIQHRQGWLVSSHGGSSITNA